MSGGNAMERVAMYLRKSRAEEQAGAEETLARHKKQLLDYAQSHHLVVDKRDIFEEVVSGESLFARPRMLAMLEAVENNRFDAVLCMDIDRLGRGGMRDQGIILDAFKDSHTKIITPDKIYDLANETDETTTEMKAFISRQEYKAIRRRLQRGIRQTISEGGYLANAPYGYVKSVQDKKPTLEINEEEAYFVRMIFDMYVNRNVGCVTIANTLNSLGVHPHRAAFFGRTSIAQIIKNPVYIGKIAWDRKKHVRKGRRGNEKHIAIYQPQEKWTVVAGIHPPIISEKLFYRAQEIMKTRAHPPANDGTLKNPLAGLVRCRSCGALMQRMGKSGSEKYLLCPTKGCVAGAKLGYVERAVLENIWGEMQQIAVSLPEAERNDVFLLEKALSATRAELTRLSVQKEKLYDLLEQGAYDIPTYRARMQTICKKIEAAAHREKEQISEMERTSKPEKQTPCTVFDVYNAASPQRQNELLKSMIEEIIYYKAKKTAPQDFQLLVRLKQF